MINDYEWINNAITYADQYNDKHDVYFQSTPQRSTDDLAVKHKPKLKLKLKTKPKLKISSVTPTQNPS